MKKIKAVNFNNIIDIFQIKNLSKSLFDEWQKMKNRYRNKFKINSKIDMKMLADYEAEEEIIVSMLFLLHEKIGGFINKIK